MELTVVSRKVVVEQGWVTNGNKTEFDRIIFGSLFAKQAIKSKP